MASIGDNGSIGGVAGTTTQLNVAAGGSVGNDFDAISGGEVNIRGGTVGIQFEALSGSEVNISGGIVGGFFNAEANSFVNISGGTVGNSFATFLGSEVNISGGNFGSGIEVGDASTVNLFGTSFLLEGNPIDDLLLGQAFTINDRGDPNAPVTLSGVLVDGSSFSFDLNEEFATGEDFFDPSATLTVTLVSAVPEPTSFALLALGGAGLLVRRRRA